MKLITIKTGDRQELAVLAGDKVYSLNACDPLIPGDIISFLKGGLPLMEKARCVEKEIYADRLFGSPVTGYTILAPVPEPSSCRDAYAFRQHVEAARRNRGLGMIAEYDQFPVFYFTNHHAIYGPGEVACMPDHFERLDFELEIAIVIGKKGRNIAAKDADQFIAGFTIMNDFSARTLQMEEMTLSLGPAKGKDFATALGPWLVTPDELQPFAVPAKSGHIGKSYNLRMTCRVNGTQVSCGNTADMDWTFAEIIERASYGCDLLPGDVIGSGTVGTGCFLELNGTAAANDPGHRSEWLWPGDEVELEITGLGTLKNIIRLEDTGWSILNLKKGIHANI